MRNEHSRRSIILIGMPGSGKSTLGVLLAKKNGLDFLDTDLVIQVKEGISLQELLDQRGYLALREIEEQVLLATDCHHSVIATGGSAVYSAKGMAHLKSCGPVIYLAVPIDVLKKRIDDYETRGIACQPGQSFESLFEERQKLYQEYADIIISVDKQMSPSEVVVKIQKAIK